MEILKLCKPPDRGVKNPTTHLKQIWIIPTRKVYIIVTFPMPLKMKLTNLAQNVGVDFNEMQNSRFFIKLQYPTLVQSHNLVRLSMDTTCHTNWAPCRPPSNIIQYLTLQVSLQVKLVGTTDLNVELQVLVHLVDVGEDILDDSGNDSLKERVTHDTLGNNKGKHTEITT